MRVANLNDQPMGAVKLQFALNSPSHGFGASGDGWELCLTDNPLGDPGPLQALTALRSLACSRDALPGPHPRDVI
jgi:hypothetical protein